MDPNCERIGYEAAALLARLMTGEPSPAASLLVEPRGIVTRRSTDVLAVEDADLAEALRFIRRRAPEGLTVHELLKSCSLSCSTLERRFVRLLGHSPQDEIIQVKLQRVMELLAETNLSLAAIAARTGFKYTEYLCTVFKKKMGLTPGQYRLQIMGRRSR